MPKQYSGQLKLILGCMFSSKSSTLLSRYRRHTIAKRKCLLVKNRIDDRYDNTCIVTHDNVKIESSCMCSKLEEIDHLISEYDVICIDEIQFFPDAPYYCDKWANMGKIIEACGLNGTFRREPFDIISKLIPLAEDIYYIRAICPETGNEASFTKCTIDTTNTSGDVLIGGADKYRAVDRETYFTNA